MHNRTLKVNGLVFGGLMAALVVVCALVPILSLFMPVPLVLVYVRYGGRVAGLTAVVAGIFSALALGPVQAFLILVPSGILPGLAFGYGFRHKLRPLVIGAIAIAVFMGGSAASYFVTSIAMFHGRDPIVAMVQSDQVQRALDGAFKTIDQTLAAQTAVSPSQQQMVASLKAQLQEYRENPVAMFWTLLPATLFLGGAITSWINYALCRLILPRFGHEVPEIAPFRDFRLPVWIAGVFLVTMLGADFIGTSLLNAPFWAKALVNVLAPLQLLLLLNGIAVIYGFLLKRNIGKSMAIVIALLGLFMFGQLGMQLYVMLPVWDLIFDIRGLGHGLLNPREGTS